MNKHTNRKLVLDRQTVRNLQADQLGDAVGGFAWTCKNTMCNSCTYASAIKVCPQQ